ncbi:MAG: glycosyltransferase family 2 protein [Myxococcaceae bacterium]|jgi:glycosyltransferase involved in cell wall biosynthesis|nr:glycosyltransferase family 2 protein [Myxococcaceae bacterium]MCA3010884.1 glycosyltransferase family 2 protein [Myxococcaceae bacterium]
MDSEAPSRKLVTIVCPVFNEEQAVPLFYERLAKALAPTEDRVRYQVLFVNNCSTDGTEAAVMKLREKDPRVDLLTMSRNFGYQASITAGMRHAAGDASVNIDVDCEDPPELIPQLVERWLAGADIAYGIRARREEFFLMHLARKLFYRVTKRVSDHDIVLDMAEFFLIDRKVKEHVLSTRSTFPFVRGQVGYVGFKREGIPYKREKRIIGETHYNLVSAIRFGIAGILSSSTMPLRVLAYVGVALFLLDGGAAVAFLAAPLSTEWLLRALAAGLAVHLGWFALAFGTLGIYLARVYKDTIGLPLFVGDPKHSTIEPLRHHD